MASYFDLPPSQKAAPAANLDQIPQDQRKQLGRMNSLMSPAVTQILEGLGDDHSDSDSSEGDISEQEEQRSTQHTKKSLEPQRLSQDKQKHIAGQNPRPSSLSPSRSSLKSGTGKSSIHSKTSSARGSGENSAKPRQKQPHMARFHSLRSMLFQQRIEDQMKTVTQEDCQNEQNAADKWHKQHEERQMHRTGTPEKDSSGKSGIGSRLRMTVRRMTTKDAGNMEKIREDGAPVEFNDRASTASSDAEGEQRNPYESDGESIDHSDVEELVRWVSRRDPPSDGERRKDNSVVEAKEDSGHESLGPSDVDELVRFASRKSDAKETRSINDGHSGEHYESDVPELGRWFKRHDGTSGESAASTPVKETFDDFDEEEQRGRPRSREEIEPIKEKRHITDDDVDELVRWVSRKDSKQQESTVLEGDNPIGRLKREEEEKQQQIGMSVDDGSLSQADLSDVVEHARKTIETGDFAKYSGTKRQRRLPQDRDSQRDLDGQRESLDEKKQELGMSHDDESLSHSDVQDLIAHVKKI
ncbi:unnamed protein product [Alternaria alternata]